MKFFSANDSSNFDSLFGWDSQYVCFDLKAIDKGICIVASKYLQKQLAYNCQTPCKLSFKRGYFQSDISISLVTDLRPAWTLSVDDTVHTNATSKELTFNYQSIQNINEIIDA